uniref:Uncharacterized protein n=1 Tax=Tetranychus urticae TaxID=32264 RepID=T1KA13_TETUR
MRWAPFRRLFGRQSRQTTTQLTATIALAILAALSAIVLALLIALLISIGSLGFAIKKCSFGFGKYLLKLFGSIDHHSHKFVSIINMITRILVEVLGRQNHQQDFLFNMIHIIREIGLARQKPAHPSIHDIDIPDSFKGFDHKNFDNPHPKSTFEHSHGFEANNGFPRNFDVFPRGFDETRSYPSPRGFEHPFNFVNKTVEFDFPGHYSRYSPQPNLQYQNPYSNRMDSPRQFSVSSLFERNRHPNHNYDSF